jgi:hypothetical protein
MVATLSAESARAYVAAKMASWDYLNVTVQSVEMECDGDSPVAVVRGVAYYCDFTSTDFDWSVWIECDENGAPFHYGEW